MCGNVFNPSSPSFLGGPIGQIALPIAGAALGPLAFGGAGLFGAAAGDAGALGLGLGGATSSALGGALGGGLAGAGGGLSGALTGAALGGAGGYLGNGGLSEITNGLGLTTNGISDLTPSWLGGTSSPYGDVASDGLPVGQAVETPGISASRDAIASTASAGTPSNSILQGYLPPGGGASAGGGTAGGFLTDPSTFGSDFSGVGGSTNGFNYDLSGNPAGISSYSIPDQFSNAATAPASTGFSGFLDHPVQSLTSGVKSMFSPANLLGGAAKFGLSSLLQQNPQGGYQALQNAGTQSAANYQPFLQGGQQATNTLSDLYGLNGQPAAQAATQNWQNTPGYQFALTQGLKGIDAGAAARGMLQSGNTLQAEQEYGTGLANQYYNQYLQGLQAQQGAGINAAGGVGQGTQNAASAYAAGKTNNANLANQGLGGFLGTLFPSPTQTLSNALLSKYLTA